MESHPCDGCTRCCRYIATEIDAPTSKDDYDHILWFLLHKDVAVFTDEEGDWFLEFATPCTAIDKKGLCSIYGKRPRICRQHSTESCERYGEGEAHVLRFEKADQFIAYLEKKEVDWRFKNLSYSE
ncbi:MAG: YkgJ family cysteine cluster protein [Nanoarchaeota archaeon]